MNYVIKTSDPLKAQHLYQTNQPVIEKLVRILRLNQNKDVLTTIFLENNKPLSFSLAFKNGKIYCQGHIDNNGCLSIDSLDSNLVLELS
jgi:hypothetical protein